MSEMSSVAIINLCYSCFTTCQNNRKLGTQCGQRKMELHRLFFSLVCYYICNLIAVAGLFYDSADAINVFGSICDVFCGNIRLQKLSAQKRF